MNDNEKKSELLAQLNSETSKMPWSALQRFFANGSAVYIDPALDLVEAAAEMALDNKVVISAWITARQFGLVEEQQATQWAAEEAVLWAVVVAPWVLVQPLKKIIQQEIT